MKNVTVKVITISSQLLVVTLFLTLVFSGGANKQNITIGNNNFDKMADKTMTLFKSEELLLSSVDTSVVVPLDDDTEKEERKDSGFDLSGYEIVRAQFFSTRLNPAMTISEEKVTFNTACLKKFENVEYVEILFNSVEKCIAVRPCDKDDINAVKWGTIRNGKWAVLPKSCKGFSESLFDLMNWNDECKYRFRGQYSKENNEQILLFDLEEPEVILSLIHI